VKILITGIFGFAGSFIAKTLLQSLTNLQIIGLDNFSRKGSELNISELTSLGIDLIRGDIRSQSDIDALPKVDWVIDCAANPSVLAGLDGSSSSRQVMEHNLLGTINLLEYCKKHKAGLILLSTSRVYSALKLAALPVKTTNDRYELQQSEISGISENGISENFTTSAPISLYGASKLASETLIMEYGKSFDFPVWINRCGVLAGAGQFGKADQGIFSYWIHSFREKNPLKYIGFNGTGHQLRDAMHPKDLVPVLTRQMMEPDMGVPKVINLGGGIENCMSLKELSNWCEERFGSNEIIPSEEVRPMDAPWIVMDSKVAQNAWNWNIQTKLDKILDEIADYAEKNPSWLKMCN
jgi:CDP-paratose 2-epimerase